MAAEVDVDQLEDGECFHTHAEDQKPEQNYSDEHQLMWDHFHVQRFWKFDFISFTGVIFMLRALTVEYMLRKPPLMPVKTLS